MILTTAAHRRLMGALEAENTRLASEVAALARHCAVLEEQVTWLRTALSEKDQAMLELRREGFDPTKVTEPVLYEEPDPLPEEIVIALDAAVERGSNEYGLEVQGARLALARGEKPEAIAKQIRRGGSFSPWSN